MAYFSVSLLLAVTLTALLAEGFQPLHDVTEETWRTKRSPCVIDAMLECGNRPDQMPCGPEHMLQVSRSLKRTAENLERNAVAVARGYPIQVPVDVPGQQPPNQDDDVKKRWLDAQIWQMYGPPGAPKRFWK